MVDIQQGALGAFEKYVFVVINSVEQDPIGIGDHGLQLFGVLLVLRDDCLGRACLHLAATRPARRRMVEAFGVAFGVVLAVMAARCQIGGRCHTGGCDVRCSACTG